MENFDMENAKPASGNYGRIITTPEAIVREHRERWAKRDRPIVFQVDDRATPTIRQINRKLRILNLKWVCKKFFKSINWDVAIEWLCWGLVILALAAIIGVVVFGPTSWREFLK